MSWFGRFGQLGVGQSFLHQLRSTRGVPKSSSHRFLVPSNHGKFSFSHLSSQRFPLSSQAFPKSSQNSLLFSRNATTTPTPDKPFWPVFIAECSSSLFKTSSLLKILLGGFAIKYFFVDNEEEEGGKFQREGEIFHLQHQNTDGAPPLDAERRAITCHLLSARPQILLLSGPRDCGKLALLQKCLQETSNPSLMISPLRIAAKNSGKVNPESFVETLNMLVHQPKDLRHKKHRRREFIHAIKQKGLKEMKIETTSQENEKVPSKLEELKVGLEVISDEFVATGKERKSALILPDFEKLIDSAEDKTQLEIVQSLLDWAVFTNTEEKSGAIVLISSDCEIMDKIEKIHPTALSHIHHIPIGHGTKPYAEEFLQKHHHLLDDFIQKELVNTIGGHFSCLSEVVERMGLYHLPVDVAISEMRSRYEKSLMTVLGEHSTRSVEVWNLLTELASSDGIVILDESLSKKISTKIGTEITTEGIRNLVRQNPEFFYAYFDGAPLSLTNRIFQLSQTPLSQTAQSSGGFWGGSASAEEKPPKKTVFGFVTAASPVYQKIFEEAAKDTNLQQKMWEKKKVVF